MNFIDLQQMEAKELIPGFWVKFVHTDNMTFAYWEIKAGSELPEHSHVHEQVATMLEGKFELIVNDRPRILEPGNVAVIPSSAPHSGIAITNCRILDVFHPARDDYRDS